MHQRRRLLLQGLRLFADRRGILAGKHIAQSRHSSFHRLPICRGSDRPLLGKRLFGGFVNPLDFNVLVTAVLRAEFLYAARGEAAWKPEKPRTRKVTTALKAYAALATSAARGAVRVIKD